MTPDLVIFDRDGVLIDGEVISARVLVEFAAEEGIAFDAVRAREHSLGRSFPSVVQSIRESFGIPLPPARRARAMTMPRLSARLDDAALIGRLVSGLATGAATAESLLADRGA